MKKSKLSIGLVACLLSVGVLSGCKNKEVKSSKDGVLLTYVDEKGVKQTIKAGDLLDEYINDSTKYQSIYDTVRSIVVKNYFNFTETDKDGKDIGGKSQMAKIEVDANEKYSEDEDTAKERADANGTKWKDELEKIFSEKGVKDKDELIKKYVEELQKETFDKNFYKNHMEDIKQGDLSEEFVKYHDGELAGKKFWTGYFEDQVPYHISHILVKLEDSASTNYSNGTISKANAEKLYKTVKALKDGSDSFNTIARQFSEDTSDMVSGDLGIMDYATNFVPEFKLGIYAYENLIKQSDAVKSSRIKMGAIADDDEKTFAESFKEASENAYGEGVPTIPFSVFEELNFYADADKDQNNKQVIEGSTSVLPRNIVYNKYLNRHSFAFITNDVETANNPNNLGFHKFTETDGIKALKDKIILAVKTNGEWTPIITVRAGSDYQGIHFIVVNRSAFDETRNGLSMSQYYTTFYPEQADYPDVEEPTFVNFSSTDVAKTKPRAEEFESKLKSYNSDKLDKFIFRKYFEMEGLHFENDKIASALDKWIDRGLEKKASEDDEKWVKDWNSYIDTLSRQNAERTKLIPQACKISFNQGNIDVAFDRATLPDGKLIVNEMYRIAKEAGELEKIEGVDITLAQFIENIKKSSTVYEKAEEQPEAGTALAELGLFVYDETTGTFVEATGTADSTVVYFKAVTKNVVDTIADLYKNEGGYCNDGKTHQ